MPADGKGKTDETFDQANRETNLGPCVGLQRGCSFHRRLKGLRHRRLAISERHRRSAGPLRVARPVSVKLAGLNAKEQTRGADLRAGVRTDQGHVAS
jgi:hypothetical protein